MNQDVPTRPPELSRRPSSALRWNLVLAAALAVVTILVLCRGPGPRIGDGYDYYIALLSWAENGTPYATPRVGEIYEDYVATRPDRETFESYFPGWPRSEKVQPGHFWFYSLLASVFYWPLKWAGQDIGLSFNLLHLVLLYTAVWIANRRLGPVAALGVILLIVFSPALWFCDKAHTELLTVLTTVAATVFFLDRRYAYSAAWFAAAATQNSAFAVPALVSLGCGFVDQRWRLFTRHKTALLLTVALTGLQPIYCWTTMGTFSSVSVAEDVQFRQPIFHLQCLAAYWVDPDIGMFPNWLLAVPTVAGFVGLWASGIVRFRPDVALLAVLSIVILGGAQTLTANVNHGGTVDISRYCLWYLFLFFAMQWRLLTWLAGQRGVVFWGLTVVGLSAGAVTAWQYRPALPETSDRPTAASDFLYANFPRLYDPLPDVFYHRHGGRTVAFEDESGVDWPRWTSWAVSDASGNKILILRRPTESIDPQAIPPVIGRPSLDRTAVYAIARQRLEQYPQRDTVYLHGLGGKSRRQSQ